MSNPVSEKDKFRRSTQPIIFKLWKLQISYDHYQSKQTHKRPINVYWNYHHLFSLASGHININWPNKRISIPPYKH